MGDCSGTCRLLHPGYEAGPIGAPSRCISDAVMLTEKLLEMSFEEQGGYIEEKSWEGVGGERQASEKEQHRKAALIGSREGQASSKWHLLPVTRSRS